MEMNRQHVIETYDQYANQYNLSDPKIRLKFDHTYRVAAISDRIARSLSLTEEEVDLAWLLGMFHDIGRFEQVRRYHTFQDKDSVNHAALSADLLFREHLVRDYITADDDELRLMEKAVRLHNVYQLPDELTDRELLFTNILRDADRIDILRVNCETPREEIYDLPTEEFITSAITEEVYQNLMHHEMVNRTYSRTGIDFILGHIGFVFGLVFDESRRIIMEQGYLMRLLNFESVNPDTKKKMKEIRAGVLEELNQPKTADSVSR